MSRSTGPVVAVALVAALVLGACSSGASDGDSRGADTTSTVRRDASSPTTEPKVDRPDGPVAELVELDGGKGVFLGQASGGGAELAKVGWVEHEFGALGRASSYASAEELPGDGRFELTERDDATDYRTRIVVRRPEDPADFSGTVVVEWLNVSGGVDANPDYTFMADELVRQGTAWVGVSAQRIGVEGGETAVSVGAIGQGLAGKGLKKIDPDRYGDLVHPGDAYAYDIFTQVARAVRANVLGAALGRVDVQRVIAAGESQSGFAMTTYANGVQPLTHAFDGFFVHSRAAATLPLGEPGKGVSIADAIGGPPVRIRTDLDVPVLILETEGDLTSVIGYLPARQDDTDKIRLWEIAGAAHADESLLGPLAGDLDCGTDINRGPQQYAVRAAIRALVEWVERGDAPPEAPRIEVTADGGTPTIVRDEDGIAEGGIRFPQVDVPVATLSGEPGPKGGVICLLLGSTVPFTDAQLAARYSDRAAYESAYEAATDAVIEAGFALDDDREAILADAEPDRIGG
jgi:hypothetical protein